MSKLNPFDAYNIYDLRKIAASRTPRFLFDFVDRGAEDEQEVGSVVLPVDVEMGVGQQQREPRGGQQDRRGDQSRAAGMVARASHKGTE